TTPRPAPRYAPEPDSRPGVVVAGAGARRARAYHPGGRVLLGRLPPVDQAARPGGGAHQPPALLHQLGRRSPAPAHAATPARPLNRPPGPAPTAAPADSMPPIARPRASRAPARPAPTTKGW